MALQGLPTGSHEIEGQGWRPGEGQGPARRGSTRAHSRLSGLLRERPGVRASEEARSLSGLPGARAAPPPRLAPSA